MIVYLEGTSESTGTTMQARYSYRNGDVLWGHRFKQAVTYDIMSMNYVIDFDNFERTISVSEKIDSYDFHHSLPITIYKVQSGEGG